MKFSLGDRRLISELFGCKILVEGRGERMGDTREAAENRERAMHQSTTATVMLCNKSSTPHTTHGYIIRAYSFLFSFFFKGPNVAYGSSQTRGQTGTIAASLHHSHGNVGSKPCL